jgi:hypothetical protein
MVKPQKPGPDKTPGLESRCHETLSAADSGHSQRPELVQLLRDAVARVVFIEDAIEEGDTGMAFSVARDIELDLRAAVSHLGERDDSELRRPA